MIVKTPRERAYLAKSGNATAKALVAGANRVVPWLTPKDVDEAVERAILAEGCEPAFKGYRGYPCASCVSVNGAVLHGIPDARPFEPGDVVTIDTGSVYKGFHSDAAVTVLVRGGANDLEKVRLMQCAEAALAAGVGAAMPGPVQAVSEAISRAVLASPFRLVESYGGHGVGLTLHEEPFVPNYPPSYDRLEVGSVIAIEPMVTTGSGKTIVDADGWTIRTADGAVAVHVEHTVLVTALGPVIFTKC